MKLNFKDSSKEFKCTFAKCGVICLSKQELEVHEDKRHKKL